MAELSNFQQRVTSGIFGGAVFIGAIWFSQWTFAILFGILGLLGLHEFYNLLKKRDYAPSTFLGLLLGGLLYVLSFLAEKDIVSAQTLYVLLPLVGFIFLSELFRNKPQPFNNISLTILGVLYITGSFSLLPQLVFFTGAYEYKLLLGLLFLIWTADSGAYFVGKNFGKRKILERVSPGKSWEGWFGGLVFSLALAVGLFYWFGLLGLWQWLAIAVLVNIFGVLGDLTESLLKRSLGVKDSGTLIPGHGGVLDRFDSLIMITPMVVAFLKIF